MAVLAGVLVFVGVKLLVGVGVFRQVALTRLMSSTHKMDEPTAWGWKTIWVAFWRFWSKVPVLAPGFVKVAVFRLRLTWVQVEVALKVAWYQT